MAKLKEKEKDTGYLEWFRSSDETRKGYIEGGTFAAKSVEYSIVDGLALLEGDIVIGTVEQMESQGEMDWAELPASGVLQGIAVVPERFRWPRGEIPFEIEDSYPNPQLILDAVRHWEQNTRLRFPRRSPANAAQYPNFVRFVNRDGCWSQVGMRGGMQEISVGIGCGFGAAVHEIGHAAGLFHEQSREDRDRHIRINWENIIPGREHNFNQHITDGDDIGPYDYDSIMHYPTTAFSRNGQPTIVPLEGQAVGQRSALSAGDMAAIRFMYPQLEPSRSWSGVQFRGVVPAYSTRTWFTHSWPAHWYVLWSLVPTGPIQDRNPQIDWKVQIERQADALLKYYLKVRNVSNTQVSFEARYTVLGWTRQAR